MSQDIVFTMLQGRLPHGPTILLVNSCQSESFTFFDTWLKGRVLKDLGRAWAERKDSEHLSRTDVQKTKLQSSADLVRHAVRENIVPN